ncbi:MAG: hypothetical protein KDI01_04675 [Halioglobus sp.]|nr:hypothetical protein [Halioglobus sp.]
MIFAPDWHRALVVLGALALLAGCGPTEVVVKGSFPPPLLESLPLTLGVWYADDFAHHEFSDEASGRSSASWVVKSGEAQVQMWDTLLAGMFDQLVHLDSKPGPGQTNPVVDAVLIPTVDELQYAIPAHTNVKVYEIWMRYRFELVTSDGQPIAEWTMSAYGKTPTAFMRSDQAAVNLAAVVALRDAGANFATHFTRVPAVRDWLQHRPQRQPRQAAEVLP